MVAPTIRPATTIVATEFYLSIEEEENMTRKDALAEFGETRACQLFRQKGFTVDRMPKNFPFFDLMATRGSCRLLVPVKTRNKTTSKGTPKLNAYSLYEKPGHYAAAKKIADFAGAKIFWVTVAVDAKAKTFSAYMGDVAKLSSPKRIPMHPKRHVPNHKSLVIDQPHDGICKAWSNVEGTVPRNS
jgi:hypothetical protein